MSSKRPLLRTNVLLCTSAKVKIKLQESITAVQDPKCRQFYRLCKETPFTSHTNHLRKESCAEGVLPLLQFVAVLNNE